MRYGIFSDVHSNLEAFREVLSFLQKGSVDRYISIGDLVGYGADPNECIEIARNLSPVSVVGNHDLACINKLSVSVFTDRAKDAILWTRKTLNRESVDYLGSLDLVAEIGDLTAVHGTLDNPAAFEYMMEKKHAEGSFGVMAKHLLFVGHTHVPGIFRTDGRSIKYYVEKKITVRANYKYIVNTGSVGQPRDGMPDACCVIYDTDSAEIELHRVKYDYKKAQQKILEAGLPSSLALRLESGI